MSTLDAIVIPTGGTPEIDLERARKAIDIGGLAANYIVSGIGPDTDRVLQAGEYSKDSTNIGRAFEAREYLEWGEYDFHSALWDYMALRYDEETGKGRFGIDTQALNSRQNLTCTFPVGQEGEYLIVSDSLHNARFWVLEKKKKLLGKMSREVKIRYASSKKIRDMSKSEIFRGIVLLAKDALIG